MTSRPQTAARPASLSLARLSAEQMLEGYRARKFTPRDVIDADKAAQANGLDVVGWYHSHPDHPAKPSEYDREHAWPWYSYVIVKVEKGEAREMTSWRLNEDRKEYQEERIELNKSRSNE